MSGSTSTVNGNADRGKGVIHNELYRGVLVFGRQTWLKDRSTRTRNARKGDPANTVRQEVPALRIASEDALAQGPRSPRRKPARSTRYRH